MLGLEDLSMDDWHRRLVKELTQETVAGFLPDSAAGLEIAFGQARSALAYALELARAHRIPAAGNVAGDSIWLQLGDGRIRFTLNRRAGEVVVIRPGQDEAHFAPGAADTPQLGALARDAIDTLVAAWRALPAAAKLPSAPPSDFEDEPTKG
jgi:hypothetical protein